jgi:tRNA nucleotidyltransferase/poly(A) polymerase
MTREAAPESDRESQPPSPESFATWIVSRLQESGHQALFAGGCVRDRLLGQVPKDYDVATSATPDQVRAVFGQRRTLPVGAAFGVITVIGTKTTGNVEVATFRRDGSYSDGRHPDQVTFSDARHDAQRRDFTINGLFYDPLARCVLDYVAGEVDLHQGLIRAIGCPRERFGEDHLRMLRALRFATVLDFAMDQATLAAIQDLAPQIGTVSGERIAVEIHKIAASPHRGRGWLLLHDSGLMGQLLPWLDIARRPADQEFHDLCRSLSAQPLLDSPLEVTVATTIVWDRIRAVQPRWIAGHRGSDVTVGWGEWAEIVAGCQPIVQGLITRWRLSNHSKAVLRAMQELLPTVAWADQLPWSRVQPVVTAPHIRSVLQIADLLQRIGRLSAAGIQRCRDALGLPSVQLDPPAHLSGTDLLKLGVPAGPRLGQLLLRVREMQLDGLLVDRAAAEAWLHDHLREPS